MIVDAEPLFRRILRRALETDDGIEVIAEADDARDALLELRAQNPDVVVMEAGGVREVLRDAPDAKVVAFSAGDDLRSARETLAAGAASFVPKALLNAEVAAAIREVAAGMITYVPPVVGGGMIAAEAEERRRATEGLLTAREREVLRLLAHGYTNQEIADQLYVSVRTAAMNRSRVMRKLGVRTRAELVRHAISEGLLRD